MKNDDLLNSQTDENHENAKANYALESLAGESDDRQ